VSPINFGFAHLRINFQQAFREDCPAERYILRNGREPKARFIKVITLSAIKR
jgi:hypothetical protein